MIGSIASTVQGGWQAILGLAEYNPYAHRHRHASKSGVGRMTASAGPASSRAPRRSTTVPSRTPPRISCLFFCRQSTSHRAMHVLDIATATGAFGRGYRRLNVMQMGAVIGRDLPQSPLCRRHSAKAQN